MPKNLINWTNYNDEECKAAWKKLISEYSISDIMYALYGGILSEAVEMDSGICGKRPHFGKLSSSETIKLTTASEVYDNRISYEEKLPFEVLENIVSNHHKIIEDYDEHYKGIFKKEDLEDVHFEFQIRWNKE